MGPAILGFFLDSSLIIEAERKRQTVEDFLTAIRQAFGEIEIAISVITVAELAHGVARAKSPDVAMRRRAFIDEMKKHVPVRPVTDAAAEIAGAIGGEQAGKGLKLPIDDLLIAASAIE